MRDPNKPDMSCARVIPKEWLIKYLAATVNDSRASKSAKHMKLILQCQKQK